MRKGQVQTGLRHAAEVAEVVASASDDLAQDAAHDLWGERQFNVKVNEHVMQEGMRRRARGKREGSGAILGEKEMRTLGAVHESLARDYRVLHQLEGVHDDINDGNEEETKREEDVGGGRGGERKAACRCQQEKGRGRNEKVGERRNEKGRRLREDKRDARLEYHKRTHRLPRSSQGVSRVCSRLEIDYMSVRFGVTEANEKEAVKK
ncbi:hypothetical protein B0H19DRAFT_1072852 [Mycena capillaripes]|nr:hypothetical protein B0H19DRAFT_1072852 [Mycena capillaripes]